MNRWDERLLGAVRCSPGGPMMRFASQDMDSWLMESIPAITCDSRFPALLVAGLSPVFPQVLHACMISAEDDRVGGGYA